MRVPKRRPVFACGRGTSGDLDPAGFFQTARDQTPFVAAECGELTFLVSTSDQSLGRGVFVHGRPRRDMRLLRKAVRRLRQAGHALDGLFVDVGANIGTTTLTALGLGFSRAVAVEPEPTSARLIAASAALNGLAERVRVVQAAAGASDGEVRLALHPTRSTSHTVSDAGVPVRCVRLDSLRLEGVSLLWIDAEGSEGQILQGAPELLAARPPIVLEFAPGWLREKSGLEQVLETAARYSAVVHPARPQPLVIEDLAASMDGDDRTDLLLVP